MLLVVRFVPGPATVVLNVARALQLDAHDSGRRLGSSSCARDFTCSVHTHRAARGESIVPAELTTLTPPTCQPATAALRPVNAAAPTALRILRSAMAFPKTMISAIVLFGCAAAAMGAAVSYNPISSTTSTPIPIGEMAEKYFVSGAKDLKSLGPKVRVTGNRRPLLCHVTTGLCLDFARILLACTGMADPPTTFVLLYLFRCPTCTCPTMLTPSGTASLQAAPCSGWVSARAAVATGECRPPRLALPPGSCLVQRPVPHCGRALPP